jgi:cardiolipin synthase
MALSPTPVEPDPPETWKIAMELTQILALLATATVLAGFVCAIIAIWRARTSEGAIAWAISLIAMPYLALPLFLIFGRRRFQGYVARRRSSDLIAHQAPMERQVFPDQTELSQRQLGEIKVIESLADMPFTLGNDARLLIDGPAIFEAIFRAIDEAESYVLVQFYIIRDDDVGRRLADALLDCLARGVRVYLLYDALGSYDLPAAFARSLRDAGAEVCAFAGTTRRVGRLQINFRNHRKTVVVDGRIALVGGHNVGEEYLNRHPKLTPWRDTHVEVRGPAAAATQISFAEDWYWATGVLPIVDWTPHRAPGSCAALPLATGPADELEPGALLFVHALHQAHRRLWVVSPYFVPNGSIIDALKLAALRGVDVRILLPGVTDNRLAQLAGSAYLEELLPAGVRLFRYQDGFLHQKVLLIDDDLATIGTANLDNRSMRLNFELTMVFADADFATEVEQMLAADFERSQEIDWRSVRRPWWWRAATRGARLLAPVL